MRSRRRGARSRAALAAGLALVAPRALAAVPEAGVGDCPIEMRALLEKTFLKLDVLTLEVRLGPADSARVRALLRSGGDPVRLPDAIADVAVHSRDARAEIVFKRGASQRQFLNGIGDNLERVGEAGVLGPERLRGIVEAMPLWFGFLSERRVHKGDRIQYTILGDRLRTRYRSASGETLLDLLGEGAEHRLAVLGSYFVPGSDFRDQLIESALDAKPCSEAFTPR